MITIRVIGTPAPQGSKRHIGRGVMIESSEKVAPWREAVANAAVEQVPELERGLDGPIGLSVYFALKAPVSASRKRLALGPIGPPDLSKLIRATEDALTTAGIWRDDARVVAIRAGKRYARPGEATGADISVYRESWPVRPHFFSTPLKVESLANAVEITPEEDAEAKEADLKQRTELEER